MTHKPKVTRREDLALTPGICAEVSLNKLTDELPNNGPYSPMDPAFAMAFPCRYCGHGHCLPQLPCQWCVTELRIAALEARITELEQQPEPPQ